MFEGLVVQLLRAHRNHDGFCEGIAYRAAERRGTEIDFNLSRGDEHLEIEVKSRRAFTEYWRHGPRAIADRSDREFFGCVDDDPPWIRQYTAFSVRASACATRCAPESPV